MRFFAEQFGFIWEFNSLGEYVKFMLGRLLGYIIFFSVLGLIFWFIS